MFSVSWQGKQALNAWLQNSFPELLWSQLHSFIKLCDMLIAALLPTCRRIIERAALTKVTACMLGE